MIDIEKQTIEAVKKVGPAVVSIVISKIMPKIKQTPFFGPFGFFGMPIPEGPEENLHPGERLGGHGF